jgi:hypothetical protein
MKSTIVDKGTNIEERTYPYIGKCVSNGETTCILFSAQNTGTILSTSDNLYEIGYYDKNWHESKFTILDPNTQIILQNY